MKTICVKFVRDTNLDMQKDDIQYSGFKFAWPNDKPIQTGLNKFCQRGIRLFFGKEGIKTEQATLNLHCQQVQENDPLTHAPENTKVRRFFLIRKDNLGIIHFVNGIPTDVAFDLNIDETEVIHWIGLDQLQNGEKICVDIYASSAA